MSGSVLLVRADAGRASGLGHVMRSLALAQAWRALGGTAVFLSRELPGALRDRILTEGFLAETLGAKAGSAEDLRETVARATALGAAVVVDGYHLGRPLAQGLAESGIPTLLIDDDGCDGELACEVLNANLYAMPSLYPGARCSPLLGPGYALLREELVSRAWPSHGQPPIARRLVVSFGGSDPAGLSGPAAACGRAAGFEEVVVVLGPEAAAPAAIPGVHVLRSPSDPFTEFQQADLVLSAAGSTVWELAFLGRPMALVAVVPNQRRTVEALAAAGVGYPLGDARAFLAAPPTTELAGIRADESTRSDMSTRARKLVDGAGAGRVARHLWRLAQAGQP